MKTQPQSAGTDDALGMPLSARSFRAFADFITSEVGIRMNEAKISMLQSRLLRRVRENQLHSLDEYLEYLFHSPAADEERTHFIDAITTNKTDFFREPAHFTFMARTIAAGARPGVKRHFKVWCAGCSSGEEAYTIGMVLEECAARTSGFSYSILATDISNRVLRHAERAVYRTERIEPIPEELRRKYLLRSKDPSKQEVRIAAALRSSVTFRRLNFMDTTYSVTGMFDVIFFRNVMIYFDKATQASVVNRLCRNLASGGHLFIGHSESLVTFDVPLRQVAPAVYVRV